MGDIINCPRFIGLHTHTHTHTHKYVNPYMMIQCMYVYCCGIVAFDCLVCVCVNVGHKTTKLIFGQEDNPLDWITFNGVCSNWIYLGTHTYIAPSLHACMLIFVILVVEILSSGQARQVGGAANVGQFK